MAELMDQPVKTFSIGFTAEEYNELPYARMVAERYKTNHHEFIVTPDALSIFPELVWHYKRTFRRFIRLPTYYVSKMARQFVTVVLTGDAGDENFAGYPRYQFNGKYAPDYGPRYPTLLERIFFPRRDARLSPFVARSKTGWQDIRRLRDLSRERLFYYYRITHFTKASNRICTLRISTRR